eukprot:snap_masked-scaffold818_size92908-processed-gene-0.13 protein:Tk10600 transcript:snap_masked-scaffold818_size92908-processed-gene-0.13-mRNA-1 annotation:"hypothetical protein OsI_16083"
MSEFERLGITELGWETRESHSDLVETRIGVFDDALGAELLHRPISVNGDRTVLDVQLLEATASVGNVLEALIADHLAALQAELLQTGTVLAQELEAHVGHVALANVERAESGAGFAEALEGDIAHGLAASDVEVAELVAQLGDLLDARVGDEAVDTLARSCSRLRSLDIGKCDVTDVGLKVLSENCPNLKKLSVKSCEMVSDQGIQLIAYYCRGLQQLNVQDCPISSEGYKTVKKFCRRCIIEHSNPGFF